MDLKVCITSAIFRSKGNYFIVIQLDELQFPSKETKTTKFRTEVIPLTSAPKFQKNVFTFEALNLGSRLTLKVGVFHSNYGEDTQNNQALFTNSKFEGSTVMVLTQRMITLLREKPSVDQEVKIIDKEKNEIGRVIMALKFKANTFEQKIDEDIRLVGKIYFDPYEDDPDVIKRNLTKVSKSLEEKQAELEDALKKLDFIRSANKSVNNELALLKKEKDNEEADNIDMKKKLEKSTSIKELNIQVDLLKGTEAGRDLLKEKYAKLLNRLNLERQVYEELSQEYFKIEDKIAQKKAVEEEIEKIKSAQNEQDFHLKRMEDLLPQVKGLKDTIKQQESIIVNLQNVIKENIKNADVLQNKEVQLNLAKLKHQHDILSEKNKQLKLLINMNDGQIPIDVYNKLKTDEFIGDDPREIEKYKRRANELLKELEKVSRELEDSNRLQEFVKMKADQYNSPQIQFEKDLLLQQINAVERKSMILENEMMNNTRSSAQAIAELKNKIIVLDALLAGRNNY